jgi:hypothetical protein
MVEPNEVLPTALCPPSLWRDELPRFSFTQGRFSKSGLTVRLSDTHALHKEAVGMFIGLIRDIAAELETHPAWQMEVLDETGRAVFRLRLLGELLA